MSSPKQYYLNLCAQGVITQDDHQLVVLNYLQALYEGLVKQNKFKRFFKLFWNKKYIRGVYLHGGVGVGKTFLMDCFFNALPLPKKRMHFHIFMQYVHQQLKQFQGKRNPLRYIAKKLAQEASVICLDEFLVNDIADAMIIAKLLEALVSENISLIITSNIPPDELYKKGLQRQLFLPAIELLNTHTQIIHLPAKVDYRLRHLQHAGTYHSTNDPLVKSKLDGIFNLLAEGNVCTEVLEINNRFIKTNKYADNIVWFDFELICSIPRSQLDYIEIANKFDFFVLSNIPQIPASATNIVSLFIKLIDVLYDANKKLICSAAVDIDSIYPEGKYSFEFARTRSRLLEMQSSHYFYKTANTKQLA